eukprot:8164153-Prorocentrum_lima.AAC.1
MLQRAKQSQRATITATPAGANTSHVNGLHLCANSTCIRESSSQSSCNCRHDIERESVYRHTEQLNQPQE